MFITRDLYNCDNNTKLAHKLLFKLLRRVFLIVARNRFPQARLYNFLVAVGWLVGNFF